MNFLQSIPKLIDLRIMYHKANLGDKTKFEDVYKELFNEEIDETLYMQDFRKRPLDIEFI